ncbi:MAG: hypothetical protein IJA58_04335 [Lachnospiraceae bacterium]|nr:hypothetical protein [Lachnospiraceae bacterium]
MNHDYTFVPCYKEDRAIDLEDGAVRIFLNTRGKNDHEITPELKDFLRYVESTGDECVENSGSERLKKIHACVNRVKSSEETGVRLMRHWSFWRFRKQSRSSMFDSFPSNQTKHHKYS